jgi:capsular exopolysaccharide synthesis family protein
LLRDTTTQGDVATLADYRAALWRRKGLIVICAVGAVVLMSLFVGSQTDQYRATARVIVNNSAFLGDSSFNQVALSKEQERILSSETLAVVKEKVPANDGSVAQIRRDITISYTPGSDVLSISYTSIDPVLSRDMANAIASVYVDNRTKEAQNAANNRITALAQQINEDEGRIKTKQTEKQQPEQQRAALQAAALTGRALTAAEQLALADVNQRITTIETEIATINGQITVNRGALSQLIVERGSAPTVAQVSRAAETPAGPIGPSDKVLYAVALVGGLVLGVVGALALSRLDTTVRDERDLETALGVPVMATIPKFARSTSATSGLVMLRPGEGRKVAMAREGYRRLRSSLDFVARRDGMKTFLLTSGYPSEGKSLTVTNLAVAAAQAGRRTVLVSGDLHHPTIERLLSLPNDKGLAEWLADDAEAVIQEIESIPNLAVIVAGTATYQSNELFASSRFPELLKQLQENFDLVLIDTPPVLHVSDASAMAGQMDGVILVVRSGSTEAASIEQIRDEMDLVGGRIVGSVLNGTRTKFKPFARKSYRYYSSRTL